MVFLARPRRAAEAAAPPPPSVNLRGGFDAGFCVRGEARDKASKPAAAAPAAVQAARRAPAFASLSRALFQLAAAPAPTKRDAVQAQHYSVVKVRGDGRCMFRALALGLAALKSVTLSSTQEEREADLLLAACREALCSSSAKRAQYPEAVMNIKTEMKMDEYCRRIQHPGFWGGEAELLVLVTMLKTPVTVFLPRDGGAYPSGFVPLVTYGKQYERTKAGKERKPVKLLYSNGNHYDLLL